MVSPHHLGAAGLCLLGGDPGARRARGEKKTLQLIPLTLAEIRRLLCRCALTVAHSLEHILHWSYWRRWHQAVAAACHARACHARRQLASTVKLRLSGQLLRMINRPSSL